MLSMQGGPAPPACVCHVGGGLLCWIFVWPFCHIVLLYYMADDDAEVGESDCRRAFR